MDHLYLYVALIGVVLVLFALTRNGKNQPASPVAPDTAQLAGLEREVKATLDEFFSDFERENAQLLQTFAELRKDSVQQLNAQQERIQKLERRVAHLEAKIEEQDTLLAGVQAELQASTQRQAQQEALDVEVPEPAPLASQTKPAFAFNEKYAKVVELSRQGLTAEQIARETEIGLGEIHFVLGLVKQEES